MVKISSVSLYLIKIVYRNQILHLSGGSLSNTDCFVQLVIQEHYIVTALGWFHSLILFIYLN